MATISMNSWRIGTWVLSDLLFMIAAGVVMVKLLCGYTSDLARAEYRQGSKLLVVGTLVMLTASTISSFLTGAPLSTAMVTLRFAWLTLLWLWVLRSVCQDRECLFDLVKAWRLTILVSAAAAVLGQLGVAFVTQNGEARQDGFTFHPGELMNFLVPGLLLFLVPVFLPSARQRSIATPLWIGASALVTMGIFATGSMSALVAIAAGLAAIAWVAAVARRPGRKVKRRSPLGVILMCFLLATGILVLFTSDSLPIVERLHRFRSGDQGIEGSVSFREQTDGEIMNDFDKYLAVGIGQRANGDFSSFVKVEESAGTSQHNGVHNMWLKLLYESGLPALIGLWIILIAAGRQAYVVALRSYGTDLYPLAIAVLGGFYASIVSSMFGPTAYVRHFWLPIAMIGCVWAVCRQETAAMARQSELLTTARTADAGISPSRGRLPTVTGKTDLLP